MLDLMFSLEFTLTPGRSRNAILERGKDKSKKLQNNDNTINYQTNVVIIIYDMVKIHVKNIVIRSCNMFECNNIVNK